jgi:hemolysin III
MLLAEPYAAQTVHSPGSAQVAIDIFHLREPMSALSHGAAAVAALAATRLLWRLSGHNQYRRICLFVYGLSMLACYTASAVYHAAQGPGRVIAALDRFDHVGIYLFIAGSYTGVMATLLRGLYRWLTVSLAWIWAVAGSAIALSDTPLPAEAGTCMYLAMGWGALLVYFELARMYSHKELFPLVFGGILYSIGSAINLLGQPILLPGVIGAHELFHLFVVAGSMSQFLFVLRVVVPGCRTRSATRLPIEIEAGPRMRQIVKQIVESYTMSTC